MHEDPCSHDPLANKTSTVSVGTREGRSLGDQDSREYPKALMHTMVSIPSTFDKRKMKDVSESLTGLAAIFSSKPNKAHF